MSQHALKQLINAKALAEKSGDPSSRYCSLATIDPENSQQPRIRTLVIREITEHHCLIFVNRDSQKNLNEIKQSKIELLFFYPSQMKQFRLRGDLSLMDEDEIALRWANKPYQSKLLDHFYAENHKQSTTISSAKDLHKGIENLSERYPDPNSVPYSPNALGLKITADYLECWSASGDGLHERNLYKLNDGIWTRETLVP